MISRVAGVGSSAGGLEAVSRLLSALPAADEVAYVVAQHQAAEGDSQLLAQLLNRRSSRPVMVAEDAAPLRCDRVLLVPAGYDAQLVGWRLQLMAPSSVFKPSVDALFRSLARQHGRQCAGIILSGAGNDGVAGCREILARGGITLAQQPAGAGFEGMPAAAIAAGVAQHVLEPEEMPARLAPQTETNQLLDWVLERTGSDFRSYKPDTLRRRLDSRLRALGLEPTDYPAYLQEHPDEFFVLQQHFLVSLSGFFRDPEAFAVLEEVMRSRWAGRRDLRIWTPGCASGEETYSLAIILHELGLRGARLYGTDLNLSALEQARAGIYSGNGVTQSRLQAYFHPTGQGYQLSETIRNMCQFTQHDVLSDAPLSELDLISCRNLLIYLQPELQARLMHRFYQALRPEGLLFIAPTETVGVEGANLFKPLDRFHRLYCRRARS